MSTSSSSSSTSQESKTVIITGGFTGIGLATAELLIKTGGYRIALCGRRESLLETARSRLRDLSPQAEELVSFHVADLSDEAQLDQCFEKIITTHKDGIYGLINNAGRYPFGGLEETSSVDWDDVFDVNLKAAFLSCKKIAPALKKNQNGGPKGGPRGGRIINISSTAGILPNHFALAYSVSKAALIQFTKTIAKELGPFGITVNCISPGIVRSPMHSAYHSNKQEVEEFYNRRGSAFPLGRVGEPSDIAGAIRFLLSEEAAWMTGENLVIDGGRLLT